MYWYVGTLLGSKISIDQYVYEYVWSIYIMSWASYQIRKIAGCANAPGMPGTFSPPPQFSNPDIHHGTCITHMPWCMLGSQTRGVPWSRCCGKCSQHFPRMHNPQFYVTGKRPMYMFAVLYYSWHIHFRCFFIKRNPYHTMRIIKTKKDKNAPKKSDKSLEISVW